jgi:Ca2+-binding RTX toxin-like protein
MGGLGADNFKGGVGDDALNGGGEVIDGDDLYIFEVGWGNDSITDPAGTDRLFFGDLPATSPVTVDLAAGTATDGTNTVTWSPHVIENIIENATGGIAGDIIHGNASDNTLNGQGGNDTMYGREGNDTMYGRDGNDKMFGGSGLDTVYGDHPNFSTETGDDTIDVADGVEDPGDTVDCGPGDDTVYADEDPSGNMALVDQVNLDTCEHVNPPS